MIPLTSSDLRRLQWNLILLVSLLVAGGGMVALAVTKDKVAVQALQHAETSRAEIRAKLARATDEEQELRDKIARFNRLQKRAVLGQEHRLEWVELLRSVKKERRLLDLQYELDPQQALDPAVAPGSSPGFEFMVSPMKVEMQLLHEGDLLNFVDDIGQKPQAFTRVRRCSVQRIAGAVRERGPAPQLRAGCDIDWITVREQR